MESSPRNYRDRVPWLVSIGAIVAVPILFVGASAVSQPHWDWDTSFFGHYIALPLLAVDLCACVAAPFFARVAIGWRIALSAIALSLFFGMIVASFVICILNFGAPFH